MTTTYTLHGRPLKIGDKVWSDIWRCWSHVNNIPVPGAWSTPEYISDNQQHYAWDEPPAVDLAAIPPPLCWIEGHPVRKGAAMMSVMGDALVVVEKNYVDLITCQHADNDFAYVRAEYLTFALPPNTRPMKKVMVTKWFNKYPPGLSNSPMLHETEECAKAVECAGCQGQGSFTYEVEVPALLICSATK